MHLTGFRPTWTESQNGKVILLERGGAALMAGHARSLPIARFDHFLSFSFSFPTNLQHKCKEVTTHDKVECLKGVWGKGGTYF